MTKAGGANANEDFAGPGRIEFAVFDGERFRLRKRRRAATLMEDGSLEGSHLFILIVVRKADRSPSF
jgi:hypothetical protein